MTLLTFTDIILADSRFEKHMTLLLFSDIWQTAVLKSMFEWWIYFPTDSISLQMQTYMYVRLLLVSTENKVCNYPSQETISVT